MQIAQSFGCPILAAHLTRGALKSKVVTSHDLASAQAETGTVLLPLTPVTDEEREMAEMATKAKQVATKLRSGADLASLVHPAVIAAAKRH